VSVHMGISVFQELFYFVHFLNFYLLVPYCESSAELQEQVKNTVFCDLALCSQVDCYQHFVRTCFLHLLG
jgi:hypothetical protein